MHNFTTQIFTIKHTLTYITEYFNVLVFGWWWAEKQSFLNAHIIPEFVDLFLNKLMDGASATCW